MTSRILSTSLSSSSHLTFKPVNCLRFIDGYLPFIGSSTEPLELHPHCEEGVWTGVACTHTPQKPSPHLIGTHVECISHVDENGAELSTILKRSPHFLQPLKGIHIVLEEESFEVVSKLNHQIEFTNGETYELKAELSVGSYEKVIT